MPEHWTKWEASSARTVLAQQKHMGGIVLESANEVKYPQLTGHYFGFERSLVHSPFQDLPERGHGFHKIIPDDRIR